MLDTLKNKPVEYRKKFALGVSSGVFLAMFMSWSYFNGFLGFSTPIVATNSNDGVAQVASVSAVTENDMKTASPFESTKGIFGSLFDEVNKQYEAVKDSMAGVLVPFVSNIDVYEKNK